jgi:hypothetical protein
LHGGGALTRENEREFEQLTGPFAVKIDARRPLFVPMAFSAEKPADLVVTCEPVSHTALPAGAFDRITRPRTLHVPAGEWRATFVIGDDMPAALYHIRVARQGDGAVGGLRVHLPWVAPRRPEAPTLDGPRWLGGRFEE